MKAPAMLAALLLLGFLAAPLMVAAPAAAEPIHVCVNIKAALDIDWSALVNATLDWLIKDFDPLEFLQFIWDWNVNLLQMILSEVVWCALDLPIPLPIGDEPPKLPDFPL